MTISIIVAYAANRAIGKDFRLPWNLPKDLANFKANTMGCPVIMGRKTWDSLSRPLAGRRNIVITRNAEYRAIGAECVHSIEDAMASVSGSDDVFIIGGEQIFRQGLDLASRIYATEISADIDGDTYFPALDETQWAETSRRQQPAENGLIYAFVIYDKRESE